MRPGPQAVFPLAVFAVLAGVFLMVREGSQVPEAPLPRGLTARPVPRAESGYNTPADCRGCHEKEWREWKASRHSRAAVGELFAVGFRVEPMRWCLTCHSPEEPDPERALASGEGVTCAACHAREGGIATAKPPEKWGASPHRLVYDAGLKTEACAGCHQSDIPLSSNINQDTVDEWKRAGGAKLGQCVDCHGHQFTATRDAAFLTRSIPVSVVATGAVLEIAIGPAHTGHQIPTGDPFREVALVWQVSDARGAVVAQGEDLLGRRSRVANGKMVEHDERLGVGERKVWRHAVPRGAQAARVRAIVRLMAGEMTRLKSFPGFQVETVFADRTVRFRPE